VGRISQYLAAFVALFLAFIAPVMNLHQSSREMALEMDALLPEGEPMPHYSSIRDSALFYTDRRLQLIRNYKELRDLLSSDRRVYCLISASRYREMGVEAPIVLEIGDDLLISNRPPEDETTSPVPDPRATSAPSSLQGGASPD
jgi:hypothetical protein